MSTPTDPRGGAAPQPHTPRREARAAALPAGAGTPAGPANPPAGPATQTPPPAPAPQLPVPEVAHTPARAAPDADGVALAGQAWRKKAKAAQSAHNAALRRGRFTRAAKKTGPGMIRKPPPGGNSA